MGHKSDKNCKIWDIFLGHPVCCENNIKIISGIDNNNIQYPNNNIIACIKLVKA